MRGGVDQVREQRPPLVGSRAGLFTGLTVNEAIRPPQRTRSQVFAAVRTAMCEAEEYDPQTQEPTKGLVARRLAGQGKSADFLGIVAGVAAMLGASLDRLKLRVEALEKTPRVAIAVKTRPDRASSN
jgi:hypothetical protein